MSQGSVASLPVIHMDGPAWRLAGEAIGGGDFIPAVHRAYIFTFLSISLLLG